MNAPLPVVKVRPLVEDAPYVPWFQEWRNERFDELSPIANLHLTSGRREEMLRTALEILPTFRFTLFHDVIPVGQMRVSVLGPYASPFRADRNGTPAFKPFVLYPVHQHPTAATMTPIDFRRLRTHYPKLRDVWPLLEAWFREHANQKFVPTTLLAEDLPAVEPKKLVSAMRAMVDWNMAVTIYKVRADDGQLSPQSFVRPDQIPDELLFQGTEAALGGRKIVSGYQWTYARVG